MVLFYLFPATSLRVFNPFFPSNEVQSLLGSVHPKIPKDRERKRMKCGK
jgi:hypothetical protein